MRPVQHHHEQQQQDQQNIIYNALYCIALIALIALHCISMNCIIALRCIALHCVALHCIVLLALHCIRTCLESSVGYPEISQWPLDFITRSHAHVLRDTFTFAVAYDRIGIFCEICRKQSMAPRFSSSDSCTWERQEDTQTSRHKERQQERPTDKQKHLYKSHPFSLFPFHAKPGLTRLGQGRRIYI